MHIMPDAGEQGRRAPGIRRIITVNLVEAVALGTAPLPFETEPLLKDSQTGSLLKAQGSGTPASRQPTPRLQLCEATGSIS